MEAVGAAASILAIAGAGIQISLKLIAFADQVGTASKRIQDVGTDVSVTAGTLQELGELMNKKTSTKKSAGLFNPDQIQNIVASSTRCKAIFDDPKEVLSKASQQLRDVYKSPEKSHGTSPKIKLSRLERIRWPFLQPSMESLQNALRDAKGTLTLILQVVHLRHAHATASLDREEQNDLIRMIAARRRQQLASGSGAKGGYNGLDTGDTEDSDSSDFSEAQVVLEAWSVTPNTLSDATFEHFTITRIPISQQQIAKVLETSPQKFREIASTIDSLSRPERDAILGNVLGTRQPSPHDLTIRSISSQSWTGSHDLFGKVTSRKFKLIIERRLRILKSSRATMGHKAPRTIYRQRSDVCSPSNHPNYQPDSDPPIYDSFSDSDGIHEAETYTLESRSHSPPPRRHGNRRPAAAPPDSSERRRRVRDDERKRKKLIEEEKHEDYLRFQLAEAEKEEMARPKKHMARPKKHMAEAEEEERMHHHRRESLDSQPLTEPQPVSEPTDDDLVKSLLAQYNNFNIGEPLVQVTATSPPTYDETFVIPKRVPRPY